MPTVQDKQKPRTQAPKPQAEIPIPAPAPAAPPAPVMIPDAEIPKPEEAAPKNGSQKGALVAIAAAVLIFVIGAAVILFVKPGYLVKKDSDSSGSKKNTSSASGSVADEDESADAPTEDDGASQAATDASTDEAPATTTTEAATTAPAETTPPETQPTTTPAPAAPDPKEEAAIYSTYDRPKYSEFDWCVQNGSLVYNAPSGAEKISDPVGYSGGWKGMIIYSPSENLNTDTHELVNIDITTDGSKADLVLDWYWMSPNNGDGYSEENLADRNFSGSIDNGAVNVSDGDFKITIKEFWKADGKEYAVGIMDISSGFSTYLALVR